ncbi:hypothetical protein SAMN05216474_1422 [Lishizhenia tianjinensis]|uniref:O-Antigen ligase n=1 Tax=Lishizhenia tianjinensis TaxID=477690 RepID=A0A1I6ZJV2_9FLAO|nr:hypothetical protein [Lishizhenia tianjinensis]SFT62978.1 hypothetical protein SAMN05216474_1422 [Lishizhenia tianjinensis]
MNLANYIFYILLFVGFFLPTNSNMYIPLPGVLLKVNELAFLLLPVINLFCKSNIAKHKIDNKLRKNIFFILITVLITEFVLKPFLFGQSVGDSFKSFRIGLPLFASLLILYQGIRVNVRTFWKVLLFAIGISVLLSVLSIFIYLPIYYKADEENVLNMLQGRIVNSNGSFGIIGLYLLFADKEKWYNEGKLVKIVSVLSVIALILTFNRTYLALLALELLYLTYKSFSLNTLKRLVVLTTMFLAVISYSYYNFGMIRRQMDKRILSIINSEVSIHESTIKGNRDMIYEGIRLRIDENYWLIGLPYKIPIFIRPSMYGKESQELRKTDTSIINVLLRYGVIPLILITLVFNLLIKRDKNYGFKTVFIIYLLASLNTDSLVGQNAIFFLILFFIIRNSFINEKNSFYSQNRS